MEKKIVYVDMDNTLVNYAEGAKEMGIDPNEAKHVKGFFRKLKPMPGAIEAYNFLDKYFNVYILTTAPWSNPDSFVEKILWVKEWLPNAYKNVIFSHHKDLNKGDYIIDDSFSNGVSNFIGDHIHIGGIKFPDWKSVISYLKDNENIDD